MILKIIELSLFLFRVAAGSVNLSCRGSHGGGCGGSVRRWCCRWCRFCWRVSTA